MFTVIAPNVITQYDSLQTAVNAAPAGAVVRIPLGVHLLDRLTIPRTLRLEGEYASMQARPPVNDAGWGAPYNYGQSVGSVLVFTCTDGNAIDFTGVNEGGLYPTLEIKDLCIIGSGGLATGLALGSLAHQKGRIQLDTVSVGNFKTGIQYTGIYSGSARDVVVCGCEIGIGLYGNALVLDTLDIRSCGTGIQLDTANSIHIHGGTIQSCQRGIRGVQATECTIRDVYFESNSAYAIRLESASNHNKIDRCHYSTATDGIQIESANNRVEMADISNAPIVLNGQSNILYDGQYGSPQVTLGQFGNYREYMLPMTYANVSRFFRTIEGGSATRNGLYVKGFDILAQSNNIIYKVTPGIVPL